jgi:hypothetical protein
MSYTKVPNRILDSMAELKPAPFKLAMALCRLTYGFHRETVEISLSDLVLMTGLSRQGIVNAAPMIAHLFTYTAGRGRQKNTWIAVNLVDHNDDDSSQLSVPMQSTQLTAYGQLSVPLQSGVKKALKKDSKENESSGFHFPAALDSLEFAQTWADWIEHREQKGVKPYTRTAIKALLAEWAPKGQARTIAAIRHSIARNWATIYEPEESSNGAGPKAVAIDDQYGGFSL